LPPFPPHHFVEHPLVRLRHGLPFLQCNTDKMTEIILVLRPPRDSIVNKLPLFVLSGAYRPGPREWIVEHQSIILAIENKIFRVYLGIEAFG
jgi:hypothetical protein